MTPLWLRLSALLGVRWLRGWGYRGGRPGVVSIAAAALAAAASLLAAAWVHGAVSGAAQRDPQLASVLLAAIVLTQFCAAGPMLLLTESTRASGARVQAVLGSLPLTGREIAVLTWLPSFGLAMAVVGLLGPPGAAAISGLGFSPSRSVLGSLTALAAGCAGTLAVVAGVRATLGRGTWAVVQHPTMALAWMGLAAAETWRVGATPGGRLAPGDYALLLPWMLHETAGRSVAPLPVACALLGLAAATGLALRSTRPTRPAVAGAVLWQWSRALRPALVTLDLARLLRSRPFAANLAGAEAIMLGVAAVVWRLPPAPRLIIAGPLLALAVSMSSLPLLTIRGLTGGRAPAPLVLGIGPVTWTASQVAAGLCLAATAAAPACLVLLGLGAPPVDLLTWGVPAFAASCGLAVAIGWSARAGVDDPVGQAAGAVLLVLALGAVSVLAGRLLSVGSPGWVAALTLSGLGGPAWGAAVERRRWRRCCGGAGPLPSGAPWLVARVLLVPSLAALALGGVLAANQVLTAPVDSRAGFGLLGLPVVEASRIAGHFRFRYGWGALLLLVGPLVAGMLLALGQLSWPLPGREGGPRR